MKLPRRGPWHYHLTDKYVEGYLLTSTYCPSRQERPSEVGYSILVDSVSEAEEIVRVHGNTGLWLHPRAHEYLPEESIPWGELYEEMARAKGSRVSSTGRALGMIVEEDA